MFVREERLVLSAWLHRSVAVANCCALSTDDAPSLPVDYSFANRSSCSGQKSYCALKRRPHVSLQFTLCERASLLTLGPQPELGPDDAQAANVAFRAQLAEISNRVSAMLDEF